MNKVTTITNSLNLTFNNSFIFLNPIIEDQKQNIDYKGFIYDK